MKNSKKIHILLILFFIFIFLFVFSVIFSILNMYNNNILYGVSINGIDMSDLSKEEAKELLTQITEKKTSSSISVNCVSEESTNIEYTSIINLLPLNIEYDISEAIERAYNIGRDGNIFQNNYNILKTLITKQNIDINFSLNENNLEQAAEKISSELPNKLIDSSYYIEENNLIILKGSEGNTINEDDLTKSIYSIINDFSLNEFSIEISLKKSSPDPINVEKIHDEIYKEAKNAYYENYPFKVYQEINGIDFDIDTAKNILTEEKDEYTIPLIITIPDITVNNLNIDIFPDLIASFSTKYDAKNENRSTNLSLAASKINETIISPGEEFSYNSTVGERTISSGYKNAKIYSNGQVVDGIGGGICQISSTLYNAVMFANLEVTERHCHQFITSYVDAGRDATVVYGVKDFKFINNRSYPIKIVALASDGIVKISIYGIKETTEYDVSFDTETLSTIPYSIEYEYDSNLSNHSESIKQLGANGAVVNTYKVIKLNGAIVSRTLISQDIYNALSRVIVKGTL